MATNESAFRRGRTWSATALLRAALLGGVWQLRLDYGAKISTDILDLVPAVERDPELALVRELASEAEARTMLVVLTDADGRPASQEDATRFATALTASKHFTQAIALGDPAWRDG